MSAAGNLMFNTHVNNIQYNSTQQMVVKKCYKLLEVYLKGKSG